MSSNLSNFIKDNHKTHLVFDFDQTIAQIDIDWTNWHKGALEIYSSYDPSHKLHPGKEHLFMNEFIEKFGKEVSDRMTAFNRQYETENTKGFIQNKNLIDFIRASADLNINLYSSNSKNTLQRGIKELNLENTFEKIVGREDVVFIKPKTEGFDLIYDPNIPKSKYLMIGDSSVDKLAAKDFGINFFLIDYFL